LRALVEEQMPLEQVSPGGQVKPYEPQFVGSVAKAERGTHGVDGEINTRLVEVTVVVSVVTAVTETITVNVVLYRRVEVLETRTVLVGTGSVMVVCVMPAQEHAEE